MRVLIDAVDAPPTYVEGWWNAMGAAGWDVGVMKDHEHVFDVFHDYDPDVLLLAGEPCRATAKCIASRPRLKVVPIEPRPAFDDVKFKAGARQPAFVCDLTFVAHWTPEKTPLYRSFLDPVVEAGFDVKFFGAGRGCPYPQHLGWLDDSLLPDLYASARYCLDVSGEAQSERWFQIVGLGGTCVSNRSFDVRVELVDRLADLLLEKYVDGFMWDGLFSMRDGLHSSVYRTMGAEVATYRRRLADAFDVAGLQRKASQLLKEAADA